VIALPPRLYSAGARVVCDGCAAEVAAGTVRITRPPAGDPAVVSIDR
jgi:hypothetical protein